MIEEKMKMMDVEELSDEQICIQKDLILDRALPERVSLWKRLRDIYVGPGLRTVFYHCESSWIVTALVYMGVCIACKLVRRDIEVQMGISLLAFPIGYLVFSFISSWMAEEEEVVDLINSMHYSLSYIISLRMFYSSIITMILNMFLLAVINGYRGQEMWKLGAAGTSSMFLFAIASISLYHKLAKSSYIGILILLWSVLSTVLLRRGGALFILLFDALPLAVHCVTAVFSLIGFVCYIRKVEKENAYSFAC